MSELPEGYKLVHVASEDGEVDYSLSTPAYAVALSVGVGITSTFSLYSVVTFGGVIVAALFVDCANSEYDFTVVVDIAHQRKTIGAYLVDYALEDAEANLDAYPDLKIWVYVVSPHMQDLLTDREFKIVKYVNNDCIMEKQL